MSFDISPGQFVSSSDDTKIWAAACGSRFKSAVVFIHGFACTCDAFAKQYIDSLMLKNLYIVCLSLRYMDLSEPHLAFRYVTMSAAVNEAKEHLLRTYTYLSDKQETAKLPCCEAFLQQHMVSSFSPA